MSQAKTVVRAVRVKIEDDDMRVTRLRGVGHRAECSCGWKGPAHRLRVVAKADAAIHRQHEHP